MDRNNILNSLIDATSLVLDFVEHKLTIQEFVDEYNSLYYDAIDGFETYGDFSDIKNEIGLVAAFHDKVQSIVGLIYLDENNRDEYRKAGRLDAFEVTSRLESLVKDGTIISDLSRLKSICK